MDLTHNHQKQKIRTYYIVLVPMFTALTIIGAFIKIPTPIVSLTFQTLFVILSGALLGSRMGALSQILYVTLGLIGIPVFTKGGGFGYIFQPTFGYLLGFVVGSFIIGKIIEMRKDKNLITFLLANLAGLTVIYTIGVVYLYLILNYVSLSPISFANAIKVGVLTPLPKDLALVVIVTIVAQKVFKRLAHFRVNQ
ncbi:biotin biosynthesis protein BioY [Desulfuribacillus stibiiarsenatis]|uniref:Biotin transporter n=1 Tax=Desulfuribacillus stibiiarsenatis TaxID=1390249 RepID=A0A1E5L3T2_9FIRM|nr:biotin transporter BioY [Desulfuribacillus stibiiarsenatis]OEH84751.1 biotin biosynthesis protein BioY [Desulfuribacillus stibiiarsenatis]